MTTSRPEYYLGIDGGGTKTEAVIADENGTIVSRGRAGGANPHNYPLDIAFENIRLAVVSARTEAYKIGKQIDIHSFKSICLGLAGIDSGSDRERVSAYLHHLLPGSKPFGGNKVIVCSDGYIGLKSATDENWGVCLIASTGSNCYGINQSGIEATAGDWGYLLGDQGSGFALGMKMIHQVIKEYDGRCALSPLTSIVLKQLNLKETPDLIPWVYKGQVPVKEIASLSLVINDPELQSSTHLSEWVSDTAKSLTESYTAVVNKLNIRNELLPVVLVGGLFKATIPFKNSIIQAITEITPNALIISASCSPAEGAVKVARMENVPTLFL